MMNIIEAEKAIDKKKIREAEAAELVAISKELGRLKVFKSQISIGIEESRVTSG